MSPDLQSEIAGQIISEALSSQSFREELACLKSYNERVFNVAPFHFI